MNQMKSRAAETASTQAGAQMARAHRIGQNKIVSSYKLIARDTVEEKIVRLQEKKKELFRGTLVSEEDFVRGLDWTELQELLN